MQLNNIKTGHWGIVILLVITALAYSTALNGRFLLDDFTNLSGLEDISSLKDYPRFIFGGSAGPSGRPVSLFTFALQHDAWPGQPSAFKLVNLIIHLCNGLLIYFISLFLAGYTGLDRKYIAPFALIVSALWLLQPVQVSTVLYVIQRMTLLSAFFSLAGILAYLHLWKAYGSGENNSLLITCTIAFGAFLLLSVLSKENGILLPVLILAVEFTLLHGVKRPQIWRNWAYIFLLLPLILVICYLALRFDIAIAGYESRSYSMIERLLTEARILFNYLYIIVLPSPSAFSLFHDDYVISTGLLSPPSTLLSVTGIFVLMLIGIVYRKAIQVLAFSILWFFGAHLLESTYLNLELYFEHRNYLAAYGIYFLMAWLAVKMFDFMSQKFIAGLLILAVLLSSFYVTYLELDLWSKPVEQALEWQRRSPGSLRTMEDIGNLYINMGDGERALEVYQGMRESYPDEVYPYIKQINIKSCLQKKEITDEEWSSALNKAGEAKWYGLATIAEIYALTRNIQNNKCQSINVYLLIRLIIILVHNPEYAHHGAILHELAAMLSAFISENDAALNNINQALKLRQTPSKHIFKIRILLGAGLLDEAQEAISDFRSSLKKQPLSYVAYKNILSAMDKRLERQRDEGEKNKDPSFEQR